MSSKQTADSSTKPSSSDSGTKNVLNPTGDSTATTADAIPPNPALKSDYKYLKDAGWTNMYYFMLSYGLKMHDDEDYEEGKRILEALRENEQENWEEMYGKGK
ncbi:hypothetical protein IFR04_007954 [Cadophora malorum]|uniref:Uncharacterized protein n=1 Tax=Cadophora malorum TaxID=108018 RepID=A0A8H7WA80_9HELO|nr:hypothetical protein IFR04_007954 [Cadophora malorum]